MTKERRDRINWRLAEFEQWCPEHGDGCEHWTAYPIADYTADLNALARLEAKLPPHSWWLCPVTSSGLLNAAINVWQCGIFNGTEPVEAEARAEAIYKYLTRETK